MIDVLTSILDAAGEQVGLLLASMVVFAAADASLGLGTILPGETGIVLASIALSDRVELVLLGILATALGAFVGDHVGFAVGRALGPRLGQTRLITWLGRRRWEKARRDVSGRFWVVIVARLLPGVRTFVAAAAGASSMPYGRFAAACGVAAVLWATLWVVGGAALGPAVLALIERYSLAALGLLAVAAVVWLTVRHTRRAEA